MLNTEIHNKNNLTKSYLRSVVYVILSCTSNLTKMHVCPDDKSVNSHFFTFELFRNADATVKINTNMNENFIFFRIKISLKKKLSNKGCTQLYFTATKIHF